MTFRDDHCTSGDFSNSLHLRNCDPLSMTVFMKENPGNGS